MEDSKASIFERQFFTNGIIFEGQDDFYCTPVRVIRRIYPDRLIYYRKSISKPIFEHIAVHYNIFTMNQSLFNRDMKTDHIIPVFETMNVHSVMFNHPYGNLLDSLMLPGTVLPYGEIVSAVTNLYVMEVFYSNSISGAGTHKAFINNNDWPILDSKLKEIHDKLYDFS